MRRHLFLAEADAAAKHHAEDEGRPAAGHVDHGAAGEVDGLDDGLVIPNAVHGAIDAPDHVGEGEVDDKHPEADEEEHGAEADALGDGADDEGRGDDGEHQLVHRKDVVGDPVGVIGIRGGADILEKGVAEVAEHGGAGPQAGPGHAGSEDEAVADGPPEDGDQGCDAEALGEDGKNILAPDQAAVEEGEAGQCHEEDQGGADHHPAVVAGPGDANGIHRKTGGDRAVGTLEGLLGIGIGDVGFQAGNALLERGSGSRHCGVLKGRDGRSEGDRAGEDEGEQ